jgi:hypothetical protein
MDEMGHSGIPLSALSKAAEIDILDVVDKVLLGNKWLRKATGIQPKIPYVVESFEERYNSCLNISKPKHGIFRCNFSLLLIKHVNVLILQQSIFFIGFL